MLTIFLGSHNNKILIKKIKTKLSTTEINAYFLS